MLAYVHMSRGDTGLGVKLGSFLMGTQFIRRERGPTPSPPLAVVVQAIAGAQPPSFSARAYRLDYGGGRVPVVNDLGRPLVAVGATPVKATSFLLAALRRRAVRVNT